MTGSNDPIGIALLAVLCVMLGLVAFLSWIRGREIWKAAADRRQADQDSVDRVVDAARQVANAQRELANAIEASAQRGRK